MNSRELQSSVTQIFVVIALFSTVRSTHAGTIEKLDTAPPHTVRQTQADLLGTPVRIAVGGNHVYVLTYRGWIYSRTNTGLTPEAPLTGVRMGGTDTLKDPGDAPGVALVVAPSTGDVYAGRDNGWILHCDSSLNVQAQQSVLTSLVGLTVDKDGYVYAADKTGKIFKLNSDLSLTTVSHTFPMGSTVTAINAQLMPNGEVGVFVALSDATVYRLDNSLTIQATATLTGTPTNIAGDNQNGNVIVETTTGLYLTGDNVNYRGFQGITGLIGVDIDNSLNVVAAANTDSLYFTTVSITPPRLPSPASTSFSTSSAFTMIPAFNAKEMIAIKDGSIYAIGGSWAQTEGDPHFTTINGVHYDFQSTGEFVLLRHTRDYRSEISSAKVGASNSPYDASEIQVRQFPVATTVNTCVSLNSAIAAQLGKHRVTYEPNLSGQPDPSGLQLRIDGKLTTLDSNGIRFDDGGRVAPTSASGGIEIVFPNDDILFVTPGWWDSQGKWYLNVNVVPQQRGGGLMGDVPEGSWLPALPDGTSVGPAPTSAHERYVTLYERFADAWRVTDKTSLFDYAPGTSTKTFTTQGWPPETGSCSLPGMVPVQGTTEEVAKAVCKRVPGDQANCIFDVKVTGLTNIANTYVASRSVTPVQETTRPKPCRCVSWRIIALLLLGLLILLALWILLKLRRRK